MPKIGDRDMYWWEEEFFKMQRELPPSKVIVPGKPMPLDLPRPKLSDILRCARLAREQAPIWELAKEQALIPLEDWDYNDNRMSNLFGWFKDWYRLKNGLWDYEPWGFSGAANILRCWAKPDFDGDEIGVARDELRPSEYVDDLASDTLASRSPRITVTVGLR